MFTARYELIPYIKQITFRLYKVNANNSRPNSIMDRALWTPFLAHPLLREGIFCNASTSERTWVLRQVLIALGFHRIADNWNINYTRDTMISVNRHRHSARSNYGLPVIFRICGHYRERVPVHFWFLLASAFDWISDAQNWKQETHT